MNSIISKSLACLTGVSFIFALFSCTEKVEESASSVIRGYEIVNKGVVMNLSEVASQIDYVALETNESSMIGNVASLEYHSGSIYVADGNGKIAIFDDKGGYINSFNRRGRGPQEYNNITDILVDDDGNIRVLSRNGQIFIYRESGEFLGKETLNKSETRTSYNSFLSHGGRLIASAYTIELIGEDSFSGNQVYFYDDSLNVKDSLCYKDSGVLNIQKSGGEIVSISVRVYPFHINKFRDKVRIFYPGSDTIFTVGRDHSMADTLAIEWGAYKVEKKDRDNFLPDNEKNFIAMDNEFFESDRYLFLSFNAGKYSPELYEYEVPLQGGEMRTRWDTKVCALFDKESGELIPLARPVEDKKGLVDDLGGGPPFWPHIAGSGGELIAIVNSFDFMEEETMAGSKAREVAASIDENNNPVVVIAKLK
jgi:hypothetical protein